MSVEFKALSSTQGIVWLKQAWQLFRTRPFLFILMYLFIIGVTLLAAIASIFQIIILLFIPYLTLGFYEAVLTQQQGKRSIVADIMQPLFRRGKTSVDISFVVVSNFGIIHLEFIGQYAVG